MSRGLGEPICNAASPLPLRKAFGFPIGVACIHSGSASPSFRLRNARGGASVFKRLGRKAKGFPQRERRSRAYVIVKDAVN